MTECLVFLKAVRSMNSQIVTMVFIVISTNHNVINHVLNQKYK